MYPLEGAFAMELLRHFFWPAAFLLTLVFVGTPKPASDEDLSVVLHKDGRSVSGQAAVNFLAPAAIHAASPNRAPGQSDSGTAEEKI
jgi:hypothetical protein